MISSKGGTKGVLEERIPPQSIDAEQAVLGAVLIENDAINTVSELIAA
ncbi:MAG: hypothetical protein IKY40_00255, partial [Phascolarctobacterium sp.]|nr:hypothetical protein [Phascolarctobacterium sp.]